MIHIKKNNPAFIVSNEVCKQKDNLTFAQIKDLVKDKISKDFNSEKEMDDYINFKLYQMCDMGLIGRTMTYYFWFKSSCIRSF